MINLPSLNWFIHVLIENVGENTWVKMSRAELSKSKAETGSDYPFKVVTKPIPAGKEIVLKCSRTHKIKCDSEETRDLIIAMATAYDELERKYRHGRWEDHASEWHPVGDLPPYSKISAVRGDGQRYFVYGPELRYVAGHCFGFRRDGQWYLDVRGKEIKYNATHFRHIPPFPNEPTKPYEEVRSEVERIQHELDAG